jgi:hypothetical protein
MGVKSQKILVAAAGASVAGRAADEAAAVDAARSLRDERARKRAIAGAVGLGLPVPHPRRFLAPQAASPARMPSQSAISQRRQERGSPTCHEAIYAAASKIES